MADPNPQDVAAFKVWCTREVLDLLNTNTGASESDPQIGYDLLDAADELIDRHPELVQPMMDHIPFTGDMFDYEPRQTDTTGSQVLMSAATRIAVNMVKQIAGSNPEVKRIHASRQAPNWRPPV